MASVEDIDISEFIKEYFGIRLLTYQKIILDRMKDKDAGKIYITPLSSINKYDARLIYYIAKNLLRGGQDVIDGTD